MAKIKSKYLDREFTFEPVQMNRDDGPITIIPHNILFDIIQNQMEKGETVQYDYEPILISKEHSFVRCIMTDEKGRRVQDFGESTEGSLTGPIAKTIPGTMASIRAFDRTAIRFLNFDCEGKVYSDNEIPIEELKASETGKQEKKKASGSSQTKKETEKQQGSKTKATTTADKKSSHEETPATSFSITVPENTKQREIVLSALSTYDELISFDLETTGTSTADRVMEIAAKKYAIDHSSNSLKLVDELSLYIKPDVKEIKEKVVDITGLTLEFLADKPTEAEAFIDIYNFFGDNPQILCGYNTAFDIRFLKDMYERQGKTLDVQCKLDVLPMARELISGTPDHTLSTIATLFGMGDSEFHSAYADTDCTTKLFTIFTEAYRKSLSAPSTETPAEPAAEDTGEQTGAGTGKLQPKILKMELYAPSQSVRRIYVNTEANTVFYNIAKHCWQSKDADMDAIDMEYLEKEAWRLAGVSTQEEFEQFNAKWTADTDSKAA